MEGPNIPLDADRQLIIAEVRRFVDREVIPVAHQLEHDDTYPIELVEKLKQLNASKCLMRGNGMIRGKHRRAKKE